tara:strand:+ start:1917 stop:2471 length:555 start_codon:yes stop_codon:yes gene_type:complete
MIHLPFKFPLFQYTVPDWKYWKPLLLDRIPQYDLKGDTVSTDYHSPHIDQYGSIFEECVSSVLNNFHKDVGHPVYLRNIWAQRARKGDYHCTHNHGSSGWSAVFYVNFDPKEHTSTGFFSPFTDPATGDVLTYYPEVNEGDIVIFPAQTLHSANPSTSDIERVIISFNMMSVNEIEIYNLGENK